MGSLRNKLILQTMNASSLLYKIPKTLSLVPCGKGISSVFTEKDAVVTKRYFNQTGGLPVPIQLGA